MPVTQNDLEWIDLYLTSAVYHINEANRMNQRLRDLMLSRERHVTPLPPLEQTPLRTEKPKMSSITGIQSGAFQAQLEAMRKKLSDRLTQGLTKIDGAAEAGAQKMEAAVDNVVAKVDKEIEDKLQEFATMTNGGPI